MKNFRVSGGNKLEGVVQVSGSKNAALPIIAASLLTSETTILHNVPEIEDVYQMIAILNFLNVQTTFANNTLTIDPSRIENKAIPHDLVCRMRASILLAGSLLARFKSLRMGFPGGCVLGKRSVDTHVFAFLDLGATLTESSTEIILNAEKLSPSKITLSEFSVTGTENILMASSLIQGKTEINIAAAEPHVIDLCEFLLKMGVVIEGIGTHKLVISGATDLKGVTHTIRGDYLEAGTFLLSGAVTGGEVEVQNCHPEDLVLFIQKLKEIGFEFQQTDSSVKILQPKQKLKPVSVKTGVHPGFPTDLLAPFTVLLCLIDGESQIFETLFEGRFNYLFELEKLGANINLLNPHQAIIKGGHQLYGLPVASCDIRAGAAIVLATLAAEGESDISNVYYIDRGYEKFDEKLRSLGAAIERFENS